MDNRNQKQEKCESKTQGPGTCVSSSDTDLEHFLSIYPPSPNPTHNCINGYVAFPFPLSSMKLNKWSEHENKWGMKAEICIFARICCSLHVLLWLICQLQDCIYRIFITYTLGVFDGYIKFLQYYTDPVSGYVFRSKPDALRYLETGDINRCKIKPKKRDTNDLVSLNNGISVSAHFFATQLSGAWLSSVSKFWTLISYLLI